VESKLDGTELSWSTLDAAGLHGPDITEVRVVFYKHGHVPTSLLPNGDPSEQPSKQNEKVKAPSKIYSNGHIYKISNDIDNLAYVGSTTGTIHCRFADHKNDAVNDSCLTLHAHMRDLGFEHFYVESLEEVHDITLNQLHALETAHIIKQKTLFNGLNLTYPWKRCEHGKTVLQCKLCSSELLCEHEMFIKSCRLCSLSPRGLTICRHRKLKVSCRSCNNCAICDSLATIQHLESSKHKQKCDEIDARRQQHEQIQAKNRAFNDIYEQIGFGDKQRSAIAMRKYTQSGMIKLQTRKKISIFDRPKPVCEFRDAWEVFLESCLQSKEKNI
jgi:hypothetical protein